MSTVKNEGNLIFDFVEENSQRVYVAEFKATGPFSLHIERRESGRITVYQKSYENGKYATVKNVDIAPQDTIIDAEVPGGVFPKWIKIKSSSEVEVAEVTFESESSGGGAGTESTMEYLDVSEFKFSDNEQENTFRLSFVKNMGLLGKAFVNQGYIIGPIGFTGSNGTLKSIAIDFSGITYDNTAGGDIIKSTVKEALITLGFLEEQLAAIPRITKEQFYNLEA